MINRIPNTQDEPAKLPKPCKYCGAIGHTSMLCRKKPHKPMKAKKAMRKVGKVGKQYKELREQFLAEHKPPYFCIYCLHMGIEYPLMPEEFNVEHTESKARHPEFRFVKGKLAVGCNFHNQDKGSMDIEEYLEKLDYLKEKSCLQSI